MVGLYGAEKRYSHAIKRLANAKISASNKKMLTEFIDSYSIDNNLSMERVYKYISNFRKAIEHLGVNLDKVTISDFRTFIVKLRGLQRSERTKEDYIVLFKVFYKWYLRNHKNITPELREAIDYIKEFTWKVDKNKIKRPDILTAEEVKKLIAHSLNLRDKALIAVFWDSGCRFSEIATLNNGDIEIFEHGIRIKMNTSKTEKRVLSLIESAPYIKEYINSIGVRFDDKSKPFWIDQFGKRITHQGWRFQLKRIIARAGIQKRIYSHLFRHSRATYLASCGWTEVQMCKWFGWRIGSKMPSVYIRASGIDTEAPMLKMFGIIDDKRNESSNLKPMKCLTCSTVNANTNTFCKSCNKPLNQDNSLDMTQKLEDYLREVEQGYINEKMARMITNEEFIDMLTAKILNKVRSEQT